MTSKTEMLQTIAKNIGQEAYDSTLIYHDVMGIYAGMCHFEYLKQDNGTYRKIPPKSIIKNYVNGYSWQTSKPAFSTDTDFFNGFYIVCGQFKYYDHAIVIVDLDDFTVPVVQELKKMCDKECNYYENTKKGTHYYFRYGNFISDEFTCTNHLTGFDFLSNGSFVYCSPTHYVDEHCNKIQYSFVKKEGKFTYMSEQLQKLLLIGFKNKKQNPTKEIKNNSHKKMINNKEIKKDAKTSDEESDEDDDENETTASKNLEETETSEDKVMSVIFNDYEIVKTLISKCTTKELANDYKDWIKIGYAIYAGFGDKGFPLFQDFSNFASKSKRCSERELKEKYQELSKSYNFERQKKVTLSTLFFEMLCANMEEYNKVFASIQSIELNETVIVQCVDKLTSGRFLWNNDTHYYCNKNNIYVKDDKCSDFNNYIGNELYEIIKSAIVKRLFDNKNLPQIIKAVNKLKTARFQKYCDQIGLNLLRNNDIEFDKKIDLLPFNNCVYDLNAAKFRNIEKEDYISITTGYDWIAPEQKDTDELMKILNMIHPNKSKLDNVLTIYSTSLDGLNFNIFSMCSGCGGNGKGLIHGILRFALGNFCQVVSSKILNPNQNMGACPEIHEISGKRLVIISEPEKKANNRISNNMIKQLCGGGVLNARSCYSNDTKVHLNCSVLCEVNVLATLEEITDADRRRIKIIPYTSRFTTDLQTTPVNEAKHIYEANLTYMSDKFQDSKKFAMMKILMGYYAKYIKNDRKITFCDEIVEETKDYLNESSPIDEELNELIEKTDSKEDKIQIRDIYKMLSEKQKKETTQRVFTELMKKSSRYSDDIEKIGKANHATLYLIGYKYKDDEYITE